MWFPHVPLSGEGWDGSDMIIRLAPPRREEEGNEVSAKA